MNDVLANLDNSFDHRGLADTCGTLARTNKHVYQSTIPESPANSTFSRPRLLPVSVNGRRLGILRLGITNCGALPLSSMLEGLLERPCSSGSSSELMACSDKDPANEFLLEDGVLIKDSVQDVPSMMGVIGREGNEWVWDLIDTGLCVNVEVLEVGEYREA